MKKKPQKFFSYIVNIFVTWRILLFIPLIFGEILLPIRKGFGFTSLWNYIKPYFPISLPFIYPWANFDGVHYLAIAGQGYTENGRFFPLYPLLIKIATLLFGTPQPFGIEYFIFAFLISNLALLFSLIICYKILRLDYSEKISLFSLLFILLFPTSFFLGSIYSESIFLLVCLLSFYFARKKLWFLSGLFGFAASLTRIVGIIMLPVLLIELVMSKEKKKKNLLSLAVIPLGLISYALYNWLRWGDPLTFLKLQGELNNGRSTTGFIFPLQTIYRYIKMIFSVSPSQFEWWIVLLELGTFIFSCFLLFVMWKKKIRLSYIIFTLLGLFMPVLSGTFSGLPRYILPLFPLFLTLSLIENKVFQFFYITIGIILSFILLLFFSRGYYIA